MIFGFYIVRFWPTVRVCRCLSSVTHVGLLWLKGKFYWKTYFMIN